MKRYVIERDIPGVGQLAGTELKGAIKEHARLSGFPANKITEVKRIIDPITASS